MDLEHLVPLKRLKIVSNELYENTHTRIYWLLNKSEQPDVYKCIVFTRGALPFLFKFVSRANNPKIYQPNESPQKTKNVALEKFLG